MRKRIILATILGIITFSLLLPLTVETERPTLKDAFWSDSPLHTPHKVYLQRACYDCHSDQTIYPWYSRIPLVSGFIEDHIMVGRDELNFSLWNQHDLRSNFKTLDFVSHVIERKEMPLQSYTLLHRGNTLEDKDREDLSLQLKLWQKQIRSEVSNQNLSSMTLVFGKPDSTFYQLHKVDSTGEALVNPDIHQFSLPDDVRLVHSNGLSEVFLVEGGEEHSLARLEGRISEIRSSTGQLYFILHNSIGYHIMEFDFDLWNTNRLFSTPDSIFIADRH